MPKYKHRAFLALLKGWKTSSASICMVHSISGCLKIMYFSFWNSIVHNFLIHETWAQCSKRKSFAGSTTSTIFKTKQKIIDKEKKGVLLTKFSLEAWTHQTLACDHFIHGMWRLEELWFSRWHNYLSMKRCHIHKMQGLFHNKTRL